MGRAAEATCHPLPADCPILLRWRLLRLLPIRLLLPPLPQRRCGAHRPRPSTAHLPTPTVHWSHIGSCSVFVAPLVQPLLLQYSFDDAEVVLACGAVGVVGGREGGR